MMGLDSTTCSTCPTGPTGPTDLLAVLPDLPLLNILDCLAKSNPAGYAALARTNKRCWNLSRNYDIVVGPVAFDFGLLNKEMVIRHVGQLDVNDYNFDWKGSMTIMYRPSLSVPDSAAGASASPGQQQHKFFNLMKFAEQISVSGRGYSTFCPWEFCPIPNVTHVKWSHTMSADAFNDIISGAKKLISLEIDSVMTDFIDGETRSDSLEQLTVGIDYSLGNRNYDKWISYLLRVCPKVSRLVLHGIGPASFATIPYNLWSKLVTSNRLTDLEFRNISVMPIGAPEFVDHSGPSGPSGPSGTLRRLTFFASGPVYPPDIPKCSMPHLEYLHCYIPEGCTRILVHTAIMATGSFKSLKKLKFLPTNDTLRMLRDLGPFPSVRKISIYAPQSDTLDIGSKVLSSIFPNLD
jgi:hypothetical protein